MSIIEHFPVLVIVIGLIAAVIIPIAGRINKALSWLIAVCSTFTSFLISLYLLGQVNMNGKISYWLGNWEPPLGIEYVIDHLNAYVLVIITFLAFVISVYAGRSVEKEIDSSKITFFFAIYMLLVTGLSGIVITGDIFNLYVFIEISSIAGYALISTSKKRGALMASYNYLILGTIAATFILLGIGYLYMATGTLNMADLRTKLPALYESRLILTAFAFFTVGISIKSALFPLHAWLPNAHTFAPSAISAIIAAASLKVGPYVMLRLMFTVFKVEFDLQVVPVSKILIALSLIAIIAGSVMAIAQTKIKRMLAYSSMGQIGYIILGAMIANKLAMTGSLIHILNHALMKSTLFLAVGSILYKYKIEEISELKGMGKKMPFSMAAFTIAALSMIGIPLTAGFVSKWYIVTGALESGMWFVVPVILLSSLMSAIYFLRVIETIYFHKDDLVITNHEIEQSKSMPRKKWIDAPLGMVAPTFSLAVLCIVFGIVAYVPLGYAEKAAVMLLGKT